MDPFLAHLPQPSWKEPVDEAALGALWTRSQTVVRTTGFEDACYVGVGLRIDMPDASKPKGHPVVFEDALYGWAENALAAENLLAARGVSVACCLLVLGEEGPLGYAGLPVPEEDDEPYAGLCP